MSQSFSLYTELTVRQNLDLHARLFHLPAHKAQTRITEPIRRFGLGEHVDQRAPDLPLGIRQRLSLAVAIVHEPEMLILDEPTSGVRSTGAGPVLGVAINLSRNEGVERKLNHMELELVNAAFFRGISVYMRAFGRSASTLFL